MGDVNDALGKLIDVNAGESAGKVASASRMNAMQTMLKAMAQGDHISTGPGVRKRTGSGWHTLTIDPVRAGRGGAAAKLPFQLVGLVQPTSNLDSTPKGRVLVVDGKVQGNFPTGMGYYPQSPYKLDIKPEFGPSLTIFIGVLINPTTLEIVINSCWLDITDGSKPNDFKNGLNTDGYLKIFFPIGYAQVQYNALSQPSKVYTQNNFTGNVNYQLVYGALNGQPAVIPVATYGVGFINMNPPAATGPS